MVATTQKFQKKNGFFVKRKWAWPLAICLVFLQFLPHIVLWDEAYIRIHDTLEGIDYQLLFRSGLTFDYSDSAVLEQVMGGLPRKAVKTGWNVVALFHWLFGYYWGYLLNFLTVHFIAFFGMNLLLREHFLSKNNKHIALAVAVIFAWLPFFTMLGISVAGQPLLLWAFLNFGKNQTLKNRKTVAGLGIISLFPFYSDLAWAGVSLLILGGLAWLVFMVKNGGNRNGKALFFRSKNWRIPLALSWMALLYVGANWQLFDLTFFSPDFVSHRVEYSYFYNKPLRISSSLAQTAQTFFLGHHHVGLLFSGLILAVIGWASWQNGTGPFLKKMLWGIFGISLFYGTYNWLVWLGGDWFELLTSFKFERVIVVLPMLWLMVFATALSKIRDQKILAWLLTGQLLIGMAAHDEFQHNARQLLGCAKKPNFKAFFDETLFSEIAGHIGQPKETYRVACLGIHPSVAQYNGFHTLDGHFSIYPLSHKHRMRKIMASELPKNETVRKEFDHFANRCYLYSAELGKDHSAFYQNKKERPIIERLELDAQALCNLNGCYLFSAAEIENAPETGLHLAKTFEQEKSYWRIFLYEVTPPEVAEKIDR